MQELKRAAAVFCIACICSELLAQVTERGWARRCIKTVAGLYILLVFWNTLPKFRTTVQSFDLPQVSIMDMGTLEDTVQLQAETELAQKLESECAAETGISAKFTVILEKTASGESVSSVRAELPAACGAQERAKVTNFLQDTLGIAPDFVSFDADREAEP